MSRRYIMLLAVSASLLAGACAAPEKPAIDAAPVPAVAGAWRFETAATGLRTTSCPPGTAREEAQPLALQVTPVTVGAEDALAARLPAGVRLAGAWQLASADRNLGGLSGLAVVDGEDRLLAISDAGALVSIPLVSGAPDAGASVIYLRRADGKFLGGKIENDAEGFAYRDGLALVSFERRFRIEAFAVAACGGAALAARVADLPVAFGGKAVGENAGPEALALSPDGSLVFGYENAGDGVSPLGGVAADGTAEWHGATAGNPAGYALVGLEDVAGNDGRVTRFTLFRSFDPVRGVRSVLAWGDGEADRLALSRPLLTDNFEGLAASPLPEGGLRVWIVSDDNFSAAQKTLLYAFDITPAG